MERKGGKAQCDWDEVWHGGFRDGLILSSVYHQSLRSECVGPSKTCSLTLEGYTVKSDALGLEQESQTHMPQETKQIKKN